MISDDERSLHERERPIRERKLLAALILCPDLWSKKIERRITREHFRPYLQKNWEIIERCSREWVDFNAFCYEAAEQEDVSEEVAESSLAYPNRESAACGR